MAVPRDPGAYYGAGAWAEGPSRRCDGSLASWPAARYKETNVPLRVLEAVVQHLMENAVRDLAGLPLRRRRADVDVLPPRRECVVLSMP